jgi:hypothetical protein
MLLFMKTMPVAPSPEKTAASCGRLGAGPDGAEARK